MRNNWAGAAEKKSLRQETKRIICEAHVVSYYRLKNRLLIELGSARAQRLFEIASSNRDRLLLVTKFIHVVKSRGETFSSFSYQ